MTAIAYAENLTKTRVMAGELALGLIVRVVRSAEVVSIAKASGHDFIFLDTQHALLDLETIANIASCAVASGLTPLVRVRRYDDPDIPRLLDAGVMGLIVPDVNNAEEARAVVQAAKYAPLGKRSLAFPSPILFHKASPAPQAVALLNGNVLIACMIETREGLRNADEIAAVDGVDILHIGTGDLLLEMGRAGEFGCPEIIDAIRSVIAACKRHGKVAGFGGDRDVARQRQFIDEGVRFVTTQADVALLIAAAGKLTAELRGTGT